jgi:hypothetical protein
MLKYQKKELYMIRKIFLITMLFPLYLYASLTPELYLTYAIPLLLLLILVWAVNKAYKIWKDMSR